MAQVNLQGGRAWRVLGLALLGSLLCTAAAAQPARVPARCDRTCLEGLIDAYLAAVVAHDPSRLPLSADVRYTENEQLLAVGDGFCAWR